MSTFKQYLIEEDNLVSKKTEYIFNFQTLKLKVFPKLQSVIDTDIKEEIPGKLEIEFMDLLQMIKQMIIDYINEEEFIEKLKSDIEKALKIIYPSSNIIELYSVIMRELVDRVEHIGIEKIKQNIDMYDLTMDSKDEFGKLLYRIYSKELSKNDTLEQQDLNSIKIWINKTKRGGQSFNAKIRNRKHHKDKLFDKIEQDKDFEEVEV